MGAEHHFVIQNIPLLLYQIGFHIDFKDYFNVILTLAKLTKMCYRYTTVKSEDIMQLKSIIHHFFDIALKVFPELRNKHKMHILLHVPECIEQFNLLVNCFSEQFEGIHKLLRKFVFETNLQVVDRDVLYRNNLQSIVIHLIQGGCFGDNGEIRMNETELEFDHKILRKYRVQDSIYEIKGSLTYFTNDQTILHVRSNLDQLQLDEEIKVELKKVCNSNNLPLDTKIKLYKSLIINHKKNKYGFISYAFNGVNMAGVIRLVIRVITDVLDQLYVLVGVADFIGTCEHTGCNRIEQTNVIQRIKIDASSKINFIQVFHDWQRCECDVTNNNGKLKIEHNGKQMYIINNYCNNL